MYIAITIALVLAVADIVLANGRWLTFPYRYLKRLKRAWHEIGKEVKADQKEWGKVRDKYYGDKYK